LIAEDGHAASFPGYDTSFQKIVIRMFAFIEKKRALILMRRAMLKIAILSTVWCIQAA